MPSSKQQPLTVHFIYYIPGRKIGCTKNLEGRKRMYLEMEGVIPEIEILEELHNKTDQEAGDIEWQWADALGYKRENHYTVIMNAARVRSIKGNSYSFEEKSKVGKLVGKKARELKLGIFSPDYKGQIENGRRSGLLTFERKIGIHSLTTCQKVEIGRTVGGCVKQGICPHCGISANIPNLHRWHNDKCKKKENV